MIKAVIDTHAVIWHLYNDPKLSARVKSFLQTAADQGFQIGISSISFVEIVYLIEKGRIPAETLTGLMVELNKADTQLTEIPLNSAIARTFARVDVAQIPDMPDRITAATAVHLNISIISRDARIKLPTLETIW
jgi:PIN domain nuclease of toxin-antitoxin system